MNFLRGFLAILFVLNFAHASHTQTSKTLDAFLGKPGIYCFMGQDFIKFVGRIADQVRSEKPKLPLVLGLPPDLAGHFGAPVVEPGSEAYTITLPLKGLTYAGLRVSSIVMELGIETGVNGRTVTFNAPVAAARKAFDPARARLDALRKGSDLVTTLQIGGVDGKSWLHCDMST